MLLVSLSFTHVSAKVVYKVSVSAGLHGTVSYGDQKDKDVVNVYYEEGAEWNPADYTITVDDDRYYFKGFHVSGIEGVQEGAQKVKEDIVFVATYGIKGDLVEYYVTYVDTEGNTLHPKSTLHGNVGDKPVIAYQHIDGYVPQTANFTGTLSKDKTIEFEFVYTKVTTNTTIIEEEGETIYTGGGGGTTPVTPGGQEEPVPAPEPEQPTPPEEIIDIDEPDTPQADPNEPIVDPEPPTPAHTIAQYVVPALVGAAVAIGLIIAFLFGKKRDGKK